MSDTIRELNRLVETDGNVREEMFRYHYNNNPTLQVMSEYDARLQFNAMMEFDAERRVLVNTYAPEHTHSHRNRGTRRAPRGSPDDNYTMRRLTGAGVVAAMGLVAMYVGSQADHEASGNAVQTLGAVMTAAGAVGGLGVLVKSLFR